MADYKTVALPKEVVEVIEKFIQEHPKLGFSSVAEFIKDVVRRRLETVQEFEKKTESSQETSS